MNNSRCFLLCVDALEYDFVKKRPYANLKQRQFFRIEIPRRCMTILKDGTLIPFTPVIWKTIFTGKIEQPKPEPIPKNLYWRSKTLNWLKSRKTIYSIYTFLVRQGIAKVGWPQKLGFERKDSLKDEDTFVLYAHKTAVIHNPLKADVKWRMEKTLHSRFDFSEIAESAVKVFEKEKQETFNRLEEGWDLFIVYTKLLDIIGHLFWQRDRIVEKYYQMVDYFAGEIKKRLSDEINMMIISDHGMRPLKGTKYQGGEHSHHAFASFSHEIEVPHPLKITDFYPLVKSLFSNKR